MVAAEVEPGHEDAEAPGVAGQIPAAEVDSVPESPRDDHVPREVHGDTVALIKLGAPEALAPQVVAVGVVLGQEDVIRARAEQRTPAEVRSTTEAPQYKEVARGVRRDAPALVALVAPGAPAPVMGARGRDLGDHRLDLLHLHAGAHSPLALGGYP